MIFITKKIYERKFREILYSTELEKQSTKDEILETYLNEMHFSNQVYGIGAASTYYFSKPLAELTEVEMIFIASIPNNPSLYNPLDSSNSQLSIVKNSSKPLYNLI